MVEGLGMEQSIKDVVYFAAVRSHSPQLDNFVIGRKEACATKIDEIQVIAFANFYALLCNK